MPYILNRRPKPKPPQKSVMTINKALKAVNDTMDWTVLFIVLLLVMSGKDHRLGGIFPCSRQFYPPYTITYYIELQFLTVVSDRKRREVHACTPFVLLLLLSVFHSFFCSPFFHFMEFYCFCSRQGIAIPSYCHAAFFRCMLQCSSTTVYVMPPPVTVVWL